MVFDYFDYLNHHLDLVETTSFIAAVNCPEQESFWYLKILFEKCGFGVSAKTLFTRG